VEVEMKLRARGAVWGWAVVGAVVASALTAPEVRAQDPDWGIHRAKKMEAEAKGLADQRNRWEHAAWLYLQAASLRPVGDAEAVVDLHWAGKLAYYTGDLRGSQRALESASERAMEGGDFLTAGSLLIDAAWVATKRGKESDALGYVQRAEAVVETPVLSDAVRGIVLARIDQQSGAVTVAADFADDVEDSGPGL
jgi:hypothetical protein